MEFILLYLFVGILAGLSSGLLGVGGGIIVVPALASIFLLEGIDPSIGMHISAGTSLASIIFTSAASARAHHKFGTILWPVVITMLPGMILGAMFGATAAAHMPTKILKMCFGLFMIYLSLRMIFVPEPPSTASLPGKPGRIAVGSIIGTLSSMLGIGGGGLLIPYLSRCNIPMRNAAGTAIVCTFPIAIIGTATVIAVGWHSPLLPPFATGFVYWPAAVFVTVTSIIFAPIGVRLASKIPNTMLRRIFALFLLAAGYDMLT